MKKLNQFLLGTTAVLLTTVATGQNEWNTTNNSTSPMYRDGFVGIGTGAVPTHPLIINNPTSGTGVKVLFGTTALQTLIPSAEAILEISSPIPSSGAHFVINSGIGGSRSTFGFTSGLSSSNIYSGKGVGGTTRPIVFSTHGSAGMTEKMRIQVDGKIGIGMPSSYPGTYNLYVTGGILTEKVKVAVSGTSFWSDYVFATEYQLKPLSEVADYISKNKHLPGVPSAEEVVKEGIDMATMDAKLLEKIEELTLYVIELRNEIEKIKKRHTFSRIRN